MKEKQEKDRKNKDTRPCEGKTCYTTITHTDTARYTYARDVEGECPTLQPIDRARYVKNALDAFNSFAEGWCAFGDQDGSRTACERPCECKPEISDIRTTVLGLTREGNSCWIEIQVTGTISCVCKA